MNHESNISPRHIDIVTVVIEAIRIYKKYFTEIVVAVGIPVLISYAYLLYIRPSSESLSPAFIAFSIAIQTVGILLIAAVIWYIDRTEGNKKLSIADSTRYVLSRALPLLIITILFIIPVGVGLLLLVIPGILLWILYGQAFYFVLFENKKPFEALRSSSILTKGNRTNIFFLYAGMVLVYAAPMIYAAQALPTGVSYIVEIFPGSLLPAIHYSLWKTLKKTA